MTDIEGLSETKRALLEKYIKNNFSQAVIQTKASNRAESPESVLDTGQKVPIVPIQTGGSKRPFFFLHGDFRGGAFYCFPLARNLGLDQPFYALDPYQFDDLRVPPNLEDIAAAHIHCLRTIQAEGPYLLGGFCNGATVAYEMARQLHAEGQKVDLLVLMDPSPFAFLKWMHDLLKVLGNLLQLGWLRQLYWFLWLRHLYRYVQHLYRYLRFSSYRDLRTALNNEQVKQEGGAISALKVLHERNLVQNAERLADHEQLELVGKNTKGRFSFASFGLDSIFPDPIFPPFEALRRDYSGMFYWVTADYMPDLYSGKSTFFFFRESQGVVRRSLKWRKLALAKDKEVDIHVLAGTHDTCKTKHLHDLTECLHRCLIGVQET